MKLSSIVYRVYVKIKEKKWEGGLKYLYYKKRKSDSLLIIFSGGFYPKKDRKYSYIKHMSIPKLDRLYILDPYGEYGSYNLYEDGDNHPQINTKNLIEHIISVGRYKYIYTAGSSKGGTAALLFGLPLEANAIIVGACQYNLGTYLHREDHEMIFYDMMGKNAGDKECDMLNHLLPDLLEKHRGSRTVVHVLYSKKEKTYERQIVDLLAKLKECEIQTIEREEFFEKHELVGPPFRTYLLNYFLSQPKFSGKL